MTYHPEFGLIQVSSVDPRIAPGLSGMPYMFCYWQAGGMLFIKQGNGNTDWSAMPNDYRTQAEFFDDFINDQLSEFILTGAGPAYVFNNPVAGEVGVLRLGVSLAEDIRVRGENAFNLAMGSTYFRVTHRPAALGTAGTAQRVMMGFARSDNAANAVPATWELAVEYDFTLYADQNYRFVSRGPGSGGARTIVNTGVAAVAGTKRTFQIESFAGGSASLYIDDSNAAAAVIANANLPAATSLCPVIQNYGTAGVGAGIHDFDYYRVWQNMSASRL